MARPVLAGTEGLGVQPYGEGWLIRIDLQRPVKAFSAPRISGTEIEMTLFDAADAAGNGTLEAGGPVRKGLVESVSRHLRITLFMDGPEYQAEALRDDASDDLLLLITRAARPVIAARNAPVHKASETPQGRWAFDTVVIDPGHGGQDPGAVANGVREKDVTLATAKILAALLQEGLGLNVVLTRESDYFVPLAERGRIANAAGGKLFISLHANASTSPRAYGTETFFLGLHKSDAARSIMERENSVVQFEENPGSYAYEEQESIVQSLAQSAYLRKSETLAAMIENGLGAYASADSRGVKQAGFYVLWKASMPAVLVELGFISNPREARFLQSREGQITLARAIFGAVQSFKASYEHDLDLVAAQD